MKRIGRLLFVLLLLSLPRFSFAQSEADLTKESYDQNRREVLKGLKCISVSFYTGNDINAEVLEPKLRSQIELGLRQIGLEVVSPSGDKTAFCGQLRINFFFQEAEPFKGFYVKCKLDEGVLLFRDQSRVTVATVWDLPDDQEQFDNVDQDYVTQKALGELDGMVKILMNDWMAVNPKEEEGKRK